MIEDLRLRAASRCASVLAIAALLAGLVTTAVAFSDEVASACTEDYLAYCKQHLPESTETRYCMEAHRNELSKQCVKALIDAGEVPRKYLIGNADDRR